MSKKGLIEIEGIVTAALPDANFKVKLSNGHELTVFLANRMRQSSQRKINISVGDRVLVEISTACSNIKDIKGRIVRRLKNVSENK
ncbi:MAG: translation initiation factor IF-1 [Candidatus Mesenet longicola]|uniref:Translation initiation factor IF-1 n=1 Tax=Candidatus Mesenet longicola TaxID=1892558 RepID=A0A8J3HTJ7_9RICK|nr:MAG: translation initiation factor IF-1 [Candidatus Mesenet longicola]GHM60008.1 MAG: translation initiation factor IF-1 [Candidatus Mesenet longicola]